MGEKVASLLLTVTDVTRNQSTRASDLAGLIFLRGGVAGFCRVSSQRACVACASPLPPQAPGRAPGCPRCATLPGPQGHPGLPPPPTVPRLSGSQSPWYSPPSSRDPAPMPSLLHRKPDPTLRTRVRVLRDSGRVLPELRDRLTKNSGLQCRPCLALPETSMASYAGLALPALGDIKTLENPASLPLSYQGDSDYMEGVLGTKSRSLNISARLSFAHVPHFEVPFCF